MINTIDWFAQWAERTPEKVAIQEQRNGSEYSYSQINAAAVLLAAQWTVEFNLTKGDRIGILAENSVIQVVLLALAQKTGVVLVPLNFRLSRAELNYMITDSECKMLIADQDKLQNCAMECTLIKMSTESIYNYLTQDACSVVYEALHEDDPVLLLYTSGTTGFPKGVLYTHKMMFWNSINTEISLNITGNTRTLNAMPLFHTGGWNVLLTPVLHHGGTIILFRKFDAVAILSCIEEERLDLFMAVPTMVRMLVDLPSFSASDLSSLKYMIVGGEAMPLDLIRIFHEKGIPVRQGYGLTEAGPNLTSLHQNFAETKRGSIGKPNFYVSIRITDDHGDECPPDIPGELWIQGPMVMPGYWNKPEETANCLQGNWIRTGDVALMDQEGFIFIVDRKKNMFISGGENVYPVQVEKVISEISEIEEVVVMGMPDERWGEVGVAFYTGVSSLTIDTVKEFCMEKLAKFKIPKHLVYLPEIPRSDTGKLDRKKLKSYLEKVIENLN
ncbi:class I adenylate-forming enzyme family protein [Robertkochia solimangrovi]|uniref:class I adenylate-forming enzyme family protein n=1 Tax=Robertkochia solimangrovi TaxID=2213046 RepID=UPI00117FA37D|nr:AMP-binding protein [Robertkochia solimangrovi]TRZ43780.1 AMP-dependent synthetase [Robertkochia solimangrovi]